jgi:hypothetical protein
MEIDPDLRKDKEYIFQKLDYNPSKEQWDFHLAPQREKQGVGGERGGKSEMLANEIFGMMFWLGAKLIWLFGADYQETSQEYGYCIRNASKLGILKFASKNFNPGEITLSTGCIIKTLSGTDVTKIGREAPDYIGGCEAAKFDFTTYLRLKARLAERRGYFGYTGTMEGSLGWYPEKFQEGRIASDDFASFSIPSWSNLAIFPGGRQDTEILKLERELPEELFLERFGGIPCPPAGLVFKEFKTTHHVKEFDLVDAPVYLWIDPGYAGAYAVEVIQIVGDNVYVVDEIYEQNLVTEEIIQIANKKPWWKNVAGGVIDIAARQHQAMPAVAEIWRDKAELVLRSQKVGIIEGIERYRTFLKVNPLTNEPQIFIAPHCKGIISEHGGCPNPFTGQTATYRYKTDKDGMVISEEPEDKNNHGIKAIIYGLVDRFGYATVSADRMRPKVRIY